MYCFRWKYGFKIDALNSRSCGKTGKFLQTSTLPRVILLHAVLRPRRTGNSLRTKHWTTGIRPWTRTLAHRTPRPLRSLQTTLGTRPRTLQRTHRQAILSSTITAQWARGLFSNFELKSWEELWTELDRRWISTRQCAWFRRGPLCWGEWGELKKKPYWIFLFGFFPVGHVVLSCNDLGIKLFLFSYLLLYFALIGVNSTYT